jgi:hypothetical protein
MKCILRSQGFYFAIIMGALISSAPVQASDQANAADQHIREIVENLLREKDQKIEQLESRIKQLENNQAAPQTAAQPKPGVDNPVAVNKQTQEESVENLAIPPGSVVNPAPEAVAATTKSSGANEGILNKLGDLGEQIEELKEEAKEKGVGISGFFDVNAKTDNSTDQTFSVGSVELDLEYAATDHFAASSALVLCGNSAGVDSAAPAAIFCGGSGPGGLGGGQAGIAVALADFHMFDNTIPPRGRIFNNQGFHIQGGRFDIPFSTDYQNFANTDRVTVTAPITTSRMQFGGFNGDGVRSYGAWKFLNYSVFWTDAMFATDGTSVGGRLGVSLGQNNYRSHKNNPEGIEAGVSYLGDYDGNYHLRHSVYGVDLSLGYSFLRLQNELMLTQAYENFIGDNGTDYGKPHELGYHSTLLADLERFIDYPVIAFIRYGRWQPKARFAQDFDGTLVNIENISALTVGLNYRFNEYLKLKFEYTDSLGTSTTERFFDKQLGIAQMVVSF